MEIDEIIEKIKTGPLTANEKIRLIGNHFAEIMRILGLDLNNDSLRNTPNRVAKMYVNEIFSSLDGAKEPEITLFDNDYNYREILLEKNIPLYSFCEHHFVPIIGKAHVAYMPDKKVAGLSKLNRAVEYFSKRPQVQERLTREIAAFLKIKLQTEDVAVIIEAEHLCIASRGIKDTGCITTTMSYHGRFQSEKNQELMMLLHSVS